MPKRSGEFLFEIIMRRHEVRSTMMTSNRPLEDWGKLIGDVPAATAILDRFLQDAELIEITGRSYRLRGKAGDKASIKVATQPNPITGSKARSQRPNDGLTSDHPVPAKPDHRVGLDKEST